MIVTYYLKLLLIADCGKKCENSGPLKFLSFHLHIASLAEFVIFLYITSNRTLQFG